MSHGPKRRIITVIFLVLAVVLGLRSAGVEESSATRDATRAIYEVAAVGAVGVALLIWNEA